MLGFESAPNAPEPRCTTHCAMGTIGNSDKCQWNYKDLCDDKDWDPDVLLEKFPS